MKSPKDLILETKPFAKEDKRRSWSETLVTLLLLVLFFSATMYPSLPVQILASFFCSLLYVRMFIIYHDYQHHAILQNSKPASFLMVAFGIFILAPQNIWKRTHDHHHNHNSKLTLSGIGSYPTICKQQFLKLSKQQQNLYLMNRHPLTIFLGYFTLFIYWLNVRSFLDSPKKHMDSAAALIFHFGIGILFIVTIGWVGFLLSWFIPFFVAFGMGSYLFYSQHNFPGAEYKAQQDWSYSHSALNATSFMVMPSFMQWMTGNIGYHHVHHLNSRIPFYRLPEAMEHIKELQAVKTTTWSPFNMYQCCRLKLWDAEKGKMISLNELKNRDI